MKNLTFKIFLLVVLVLGTLLLMNNLYLVISIGMVVKLVIGVTAISIISYLIGYNDCSKKYPQE